MTLPKVQVLFYPIFLLVQLPAFIEGTATNFTLAEVFPQLIGISKNPATGLSLSLGGQDFTHCCSWAIHESLDIDDGGVVHGLRSPSYIGDDLTAFQKKQFPCGAHYGGMSVCGALE